MSLKGNEGMFSCLGFEGYGGYVVSMKRRIQYKPHQNSTILALGTPKELTFNFRKP